MTNDPPTTIQGVAQRISDLQGGAGGRAVERAAEKRGLVLSRSTFDRMLKGAYRGRIADTTVQALAALAGLDEGHVRNLAGLPMRIRPLAEDLPPDADSLDPHQRQAVLAVVRQFAASNRELAQLRQERTDGTSITQPADAGAGAQDDDEIELTYDSGLTLDAGREALGDGSGPPPPAGRGSSKRRSQGRRSGR